MSTFMMSKYLHTCRHLELERHFTLVGRYFQIRDDYQNLTSAEVSTAIPHKGKFILIICSTFPTKASVKTLMKENIHCY